MIVKSNVKPETIWVRKHDEETGNAIIRLRRNIVETQVALEGTDETETIFEYEETEVEIVDRENLQEYLESQFTALFDKGLEIENAPAPLTEADLLGKQIVDLELRLMMGGL